MLDAQSRLDFRNYVKRHVVIGDGAMATLLHQYGVPVRTCTEELCLSSPQLVRDIHRAYLAAGATMIQTNTFSAHRTGLSRYGLADQVANINRAAVRVAAEAAGDRAFVFGTVGSAAGMNAWDLKRDLALRSALAADIEEQTTALLEGPVHGILLETFAELEEMLLALEVVRTLTGLPIIANLSPIAVGVTRDGVPVADAFTALRKAGADVVGLNCGLGPAGILRTYEELQFEPVSVYAAVPNAGQLHIVDGDYSYTGNAVYFAETAVQLRGRGVGVIGGCCGTTPDHIRKTALRLAELGLLEIRSREDSQSTELEPKRPAAPVRRAIETPRHAVDDVNVTQRRHSADGSIVDVVNQRTAVIVELDPPKTLDCTKYLEGAAALHHAGADMITLADNSLGSVRVSNLALASILKGMGIEPLVHVTCRDRNLIGQQSHLMGLHVLDIRNILLVTGDPSRFGDLPGATSVYDVSSIELTRMVKRLNNGIAFSGKPLKKPASFSIGTSFNPNVHSFDKALDRLHRKVEAGADYVLTQPIFDAAMFEKIAEATETLGVPVFAGLMPLVSLRNAKFLHHEVPGIEIPDDVLKRMADAPEERAAAEGLAVAESLAAHAIQYFRGIYLVTPFLRSDLTVHLTKYIHDLTSVVTNTGTDS